MCRQILKIYLFSNFVVANGNFLIGNMQIAKTHSHILTSPRRPMDRKLQDAVFCVTRHFRAFLQRHIYLLSARPIK